MEEEWKESGRRVEDEWKTSGRRVEDEWKASGRRVSRRQWHDFAAPGEKLKTISIIYDLKTYSADSVKLQEVLG